MFKASSIGRAAALLAGLALTTAARADFDVATDFSIASNPNGVWSYGYSITLTGAFVLDVATSTNGPIDSWRGNLAGDGNPTVNHNRTAGAVQVGTVVFGPGAEQVVFHPGPGGQFSTIRFTNPTAATYTLGATFAGADVVGTSTDVHILVNNASIFDGVVSGFGAGTGPSVTRVLTLAAGDIVDFKVGFGSNGTFQNDSTAIAARFTPGVVPEPSALALLGLGAIGVLGLGRRRRAG